MNEDILRAQILEERRRERDGPISNARQLALEKWMETVTEILCRNQNSTCADWKFLFDALEEYKRVSKP